MSEKKADDSERKFEHLAWAIKSRTANQTCSLKILKLFSEHSDVWKGKDYSKAAQDLVAVAFSLWRAAFLAEKTGKRIHVFAGGKAFLEKIIEDNAIAYAQDKSSKEWTFNYYARNARTSLERLHYHWPKQVPPYVNKISVSTVRWDYCHNLLVQAVDGFEKLLVERKKETDRLKRERSARSERRASKRKKRAIVRAITKQTPKRR